jgi:hypothetical protein
MNFTKMESTKSTNNNSISVDDVRMARVTIVFPSYRNDTRETCIEVARELMYDDDSEYISVEVATPTRKELESFAKEHGECYISNGIDDFTLSGILRESNASSSAKNKKNRKNKV